MELHFLNGFYVFHGILLVAINKHFGTACRITEFIQLCMSETDVFQFFSKFLPMSHVIVWSRISYTHSTHHLYFHHAKFGGTLTLLIALNTTLQTDSNKLQGISYCFNCHSDRVKLLIVVHIQHLPVYTQNAKWKESVMLN